MYMCEATMKWDSFGKIYSQAGNFVRANGTIVQV